MMPYTPNRAVIVVLSMLGLGMWMSYPEGRSSARQGHSNSAAGARSSILNETLGFQEIFVINLPPRSDRRDAMTLAGAVTGIKFDWVDGVTGHTVPDKVLPPDALDKNINKGNIGSWRAHMNALRTIIERNLTTALILEDDIDWDIRLKPQLQNFSLVVRTYLSQLSSPSLTPLPSSPYGETWDVLWLGHCSTALPSSSISSKPLVITIPNDPTVPSPSHLRPHPFANPDEVLTSYPPYTRLIHAPGPRTACTQAYAVSRAGALKLLYRFGTRTFTTGWDLMLGDWCAGVYDQGIGDGNEEKKEGPRCVTVQPPLFVQHYGRGGASDITAPGGGFIDRGKEMSPYVRLSVRLNMARLVRGDGEGGLKDQWPE